MIGTETREVCITKPGERACDWTPWLNCKLSDSLESTALLALGRYLRLGGYTGPEGRRFAFEPFELTVCVATPAHPRHANGKPLCCQAFTMRVGPDDRRAS